MTPIKVLHVLEVEQEAFYFSNLVDFTDRAEIEFSFVSFAPEGGFSKSLKERGLKVHNLGWISKSRYLYVAKELRSILKEEDPAIVHTHQFNATTTGLTLAKRQRCKTVMTRHHSDALHQLPSALKRRFYLTLEHRNNRLSDQIIAPSTRVRDVLVDQEGVPSDKVHVIPYGQTMHRFAAVTKEMVEKKQSELGMDRQLSLVCVSRLFHRKGHAYLFEALAPLIREGLSARLYLVGEGEYKPELESMAKRLGIRENIEFLGWRTDVLSLISASDIVVHPSLEDALSQSLIESLMLGRPIVATDISGATDTLNGGKYGKLVPPADADAFRVALVETIKDIDSALARADKGKDYLLEYMDARRVANQYTEIYQRLVR